MRGWGLLVLLLAGCEPAKPAAAPNADIQGSVPNERFSLPNGLDVVLEPDSKLSLVSVRMRYHVGSKDDPVHRAGLAHLVEHVTFDASVHLGRDMLMPTWQKLGATEAQGTTTEDATDYYVTLPADQIQSALWIEAERMAMVAPALDDNILSREREVVLSEWRDKVANRPLGTLEGVVRDALLPLAHPYHLSPAGDPAEIRAITLGDVRAFLARHYVPENATLVIAGGFDPVRVRAQIAHYFGAIPTGAERPEPRVFDTPGLPIKQRVEMIADIPRPRLVAAWLGPPDADPQSYAVEYGVFELDVFMHRREGVRDTDLDIERGRLGNLYIISIECENGTDPERIVQDLREGTRILLAGGGIDVTYALGAESVYHLEHLSSRTQLTADALDALGTPDFIQMQLQRINAITGRSVSEALERYIFVDRAAIIWIRADGDAPLEGKVVK